ncbi:DeoR/GlpR family DNA-binding transcription regulator [Kocuria turfanensis]|uniref:DeoR family transcriptional regulator n=1 Tax=Kocuria turfanensis TaxID=388357 RepID=A0A512IB53_9MICC|nr:DeoR/GlpR family DNA-binding transcription regulator [Kocuria turfanensis]GEO94867.1 DeoR family transcriptional regulator [Kocuria turfanensis]
MPEQLPTERRRAILEMVRGSGAVRVIEAAHLLGVSDMTVRRDLDLLAREGAVRKVHGGATLPADSTALEPGFSSKEGLQTSAKDAIAHEAAAMLFPGCSVALNSGTTTYALARRLVHVNDLTVVTNSPRIAALLYDAPSENQTVVTLGGVRTPSDALVGPLAEAGLRTLHVDLCFMGVHGMSERAGLTTPNMMEAEINRLFLEHCDRSVVVADSTKWGLTGLHHIADLSDVDTVVTDAGLTPAARSALGQAVPDLRVVEVP